MTIRSALVIAATGAASVPLYADHVTYTFSGTITSAATNVPGPLSGGQVGDTLSFRITVDRSVLPDIEYPDERQWFATSPFVAYEVTVHHSGGASTSADLLGFASDASVENDSSRGDALIMASYTSTYTPLLALDDDNPGSADLLTSLDWPTSLDTSKATRGGMFLFDGGAAITTYYYAFPTSVTIELPTVPLPTTAGLGLVGLGLIAVRRQRQSTGTTPAHP